MNPKDYGLDSGSDYGLTPEASPKDYAFPAPPERGRESVIPRPLRIADTDYALRKRVARGTALGSNPPPSPAPARTRDPATVVDLAEARRRALPAEGDVFEHRDPVWLGDFRGRVTERPTHLGRAVLLLFALVVGLAVYALLPGGAP